jgi:hypothetical protein
VLQETEPAPSEKVRSGLKAHHRQLGPVVAVTGQKLPKVNSATTILQHQGVFRDWPYRPHTGAADEARRNAPTGSRVPMGAPGPRAPAAVHACVPLNGGWSELDQQAAAAACRGNERPPARAGCADVLEEPREGRRPNVVASCGFGGLLGRSSVPIWASRAGVQIGCSRICCDIVHIET